ncbi:hypothetical protein B0A52_04794 [Exophiala mesophila]|uniref:DUF726 domain-containing protein n=1 Tax=Exophiala mesophila TaxID=212818 RepID=A0A438N657_EXOME|nr:hypothetical protein B0A52_04794 [Exophiala mesophila]
MSSLFNKVAKALPTHGEQENQQHEESLTTVLASHEDRSEFLLLLANCMGFMRLEVLNNFDPAAGGETANHGSTDDIHLPNDPGSVRTEPSVSQEQKSDDQQKKDYERRKAELSDEGLVDLKDAAITHFDSWRDKVIQRVGEIINHTQQGGGTRTKSSPSQQETQTKVTIKDMEDDDLDRALRELYPPQPTPLRELPQDQRVLILHSLLLVLLSLESYSAESRVLLLRVTSSLKLPMKLLTEDENQVAKGLLESAKQQMDADPETKRRAEANASSRKWKVGLSAAAGAILIGVTGGLAAPLLAAGVGSVMGGIGLGATATAGYLGAMAGSAPLVGALFGAYGGRMTAKITDKYAKEVEDFAFIPLQDKTGERQNSRHLRVAIGVSGYLTDETEVTSPWTPIGDSIEGFALRWELDTLLALGSALTVYIRSYAWGWAKKEVISRTIFATLASALTLPYGIAKMTKMVDNPFSVARSRSEKAGVVLAHALMEKVQGERPVTLVGYSLGSRLIYSCLNELAERRAFGLVESVVLAGSATPSDSLAWRRMRSVVSGRLINVYSTNDYLLGILYRTSSLQYGIAGLQAVRDVPGVQNVDVSSFVDGHTQYRFLMGRILQKAGLEDLNLEEVERQLKEMQTEQKENDAEREKSEKEDHTAAETGDERVST